MRKQWSTVLIILLLLIVVVFSVLNGEAVLINFGFTSVEMPLVLIIIVTLLIGVLIAVMWSTTIVMRERNKNKKLTKELDQHQAELKKQEEKLNEEHQLEKQALQDEIEKGRAEMKELQRRIHNLEVSRTATKQEH